MKTIASRRLVARSLLFLACALIATGCASKKPEAKASVRPALTFSNIPPQKFVINSLIVAQPDVKYVRISYRGKELWLTNESEQAQTRLPGLLLSELNHAGFQARMATPEESGYIKTNLSTITFSNALWCTESFASGTPLVGISNVDAALIVRLVGLKNTGARAARLGFMAPFTAVGFAAGVGALGYAESSGGGGGGGGDGSGVLGVGALGTVAVAGPAWLATGGGKVGDNLFFASSQQLRLTLVDRNTGRIIWAREEDAKFDPTKLDKMVNKVCSIIPKTVTLPPPLEMVFSNSKN